MSLRVSLSIPVIFGLFIIIPGIAGASPSADENRLLAEVKQKFSSITSLAVQFHMIRRIADFDEELKSEGIMLYRRGGYLRFQILSPFQSVMLKSPSKIARYELVKNKWKTIETKGNRGLEFILGQIESWISGNFAVDNRLFRVSCRWDTKGHRDKCLIITLTPLRAAVKEYIATIDILLQPRMEGVASIRILDAQKDTLELVFYARQQNIELADRLFTTIEEPLPATLVPESTPAPQP
ncbi:MAG: outer membrane lipoprotein carrier protein LolA [Lentisphaerae bacterium]|nr:MAG: outer membrane lipoprotein carrier protein LolA [Lentisphaerota bacterium]